MTDTIAITKTELNRNTRTVINRVLRGPPVIVESYGEPVVAMMDVMDYYITRAALGYYAHQAAAIAQVAAGHASLADEVAEADLPTRVQRAITHYLAGAISLQQAADIVGFNEAVLRQRCQRLDIPLHDE
jgi:prevent-host-death family protein